MFWGARGCYFLDFLKPFATFPSELPAPGKTFLPPSIFYQRTWTPKPFSPYPRVFYSAVHSQSSLPARLLPKTRPNNTDPQPGPAAPPQVAFPPWAWTPPIPVRIVCFEKQRPCYVNEPVKSCWSLNGLSTRTIIPPSSEPRKPWGSIICT